MVVDGGQTGTCSGVKADGSPCQAHALRDAEYCFYHSPDHADEVAEARRLGGQRRRKERIVAGAYDFEGLSTVESLRRLVEVAAIDTLGLENSVSRARTLGFLVQVASRLMETNELEARIEELERAVAPRARRMKARKR